jgi:hypothetical protein
LPAASNDNDRFAAIANLHQMEREYSMKRFGMGVLAAGLVLSLAVPVVGWSRL